MNALLRKEIRLISPAYFVALAVTVLPAWLISRPVGGAAEDWSFIAFSLGTALVALSSFGREFSLNTFGFMLTQPLGRARLWRTKIAVLAVALATLLAAWGISWALAAKASGASLRSGVLMAGLVAVVVSFVGGVWTTLVFRQIAAAFWFLILVPGVLVALTELAGGQVAAHYIVLLLYSAAGVGLGWRRFQQAQESGWTGGVVSLTSAGKAGVSRRGVGRRRRLRALVGRELRLYQPGLMGLVALFLLHWVVVAVRKAGWPSMPGSVRGVLDLFGGIWLIVPLVLAAPAVAEERKLGTQDAMSSLPVSNGFQFAVKLLFVLVFAGLLPVALFWTVEGSATAWTTAWGTPEQLGQSSEGPWPLMATLMGSMGLALIGFYASTLARHIVQALGVAVAFALAVWAVVPLAARPVSVAGIWLWGSTPEQISLLSYLGPPGLAICLLWLSWRNFPPGASARGPWRRNLMGLAAGAMMIVCGTCLLYNRAWELVTPLEPPHGPARITAGETALTATDHDTLLARLPDQSFWADRIGYTPRFSLSASRPGRWFGSSGASRPGPKEEWSSLNRTQVPKGSRWLDVTATSSATVAIRADGSLWISDGPAHPSWYLTPPRSDPAPMRRFGTETNWHATACLSATAVILLKKDGTLWIWGTNDFSGGLNFRLRFDPGEPRQLGTDSDWARIQAVTQGQLFGGSAYFWKADGSAWMFHETRHPGKVVEIEYGMALSRVPPMDKQTWMSVGVVGGLEVGVRNDGTLWTWRLRADEPPRARGAGSGDSRAPSSRTPPPAFSATMTQLGTGSDWRAVAPQAGMMISLKADGTLWQWNLRTHLHRFELTGEPPSRLGSSADWRGLCAYGGGAVSLAADGSLWFWHPRDPQLQSLGYPVLAHFSPSLLSPSRRPARMLNLLDAGL